MEYHKLIRLKDGRECILRNGTEKDGPDALRTFILTHGESDFLLSYPEEIRFTDEQEAQYLKGKTESETEVEILAEVDGVIVGMAGIEGVGKPEKLKHRASFGVSIARAYWGLGIGRALTEACIDCAVRAGYTQLELEVVEENRHAIALYKKLGFTEFGRNPRGFRSRSAGCHALLLMLLELNAGEENGSAGPRPAAEETQEEKP